MPHNKAQARAFAACINKVRMHARIQKILSEGVQLFFVSFFLFFFFFGGGGGWGYDEGWVDPNSTISGPSSARQSFTGLQMMAQH